MKKINFKEKISILDGAMGSMVRKYILSDTDYRGNTDILNLLSPDIIEEIHLQYLLSGADILTTNTFNATPISQSPYGYANKISEINTSAVRIARAAIKKYLSPAYANTKVKRLIAGSIGPTSTMLTRSKQMRSYEQYQAEYDYILSGYRQQAQALIAAGVDLILIETVIDSVNAQAAAQAVTSIDPNFPIMLSASISGSEGHLQSGDTPTDLYFKIAKQANIVSFGLNCSFGIAGLLPHIEEIARTVPCPISLYPSAGLPDKEGNYSESPEHFASAFAEILIHTPLSIIGGCCGTTPAHIQALKKIARSINEPGKSY